MITGSGYYEYSGVIHIHSTYSDGSGTLRRIIKDAKRAGLDYIIITDHNTLQAKEDGWEGWYDDLLVLVGEEAGYYGDSHYLALGISETIEPDDGQYAQYIENVKRQGGIGFVAHPHGLQDTSFDLDLPSWDTWDNPDYTGLEIWSYMCDWAEGVTPRNLIYYYLRPVKKIDGPPTELLQKWDQLCQTRRVVGIGSADAHALYRFPFSFIKFLSYRKAFRGIRTHLLISSPLSPDLIESKKLVYAALGDGHCFFAHDFLMDSRGFDFRALTDDGRVLVTGDVVKVRSTVQLAVTSPALVSLRLLRNGQPVKETSESRQLEWGTDEPGVYRAEARYNGSPWVFTNPIYLR